jgi:hypothetical protein
MKFHLGALPDSPEFIPDDSWQSTREPSIWGFQFLAIPIAIISTVVVAFLWVTITPVGHPLGPIAFSLPIVGFRLVCLVGVLAAHELIHVLLHPKAGGSQQTVLGFYPSRMFLYVTYLGELTRNRCLVILLMPFIVISIAPLAVSALTHVASGWVSYASILNALLASGDILAATMTLIRIPSDAIIRTKGWRTYLRRAEPGAAPNGGPATQPAIRESQGGRHR